MIKKNRSSRSCKKIRIFIVNDHPIVRQGIIKLLEEERDLLVCGEAEDPEVAFKKIAVARPDVVVVDICLKGMDGIRFIQKIKSTFPSIRILVVSIYDENAFAERALRAGARGYVMTQESAEKLIAAIRAVSTGELAVSKAVAMKLMERSLSTSRREDDLALESLSDRELEVFRRIGKGLSPSQIAEELNLSVKTVQAHRHNIKQKLGLKSSAHLIHRAIEWVKNLTHSHQ